MTYRCRGPGRSGPWRRCRPYRGRWSPRRRGPRPGRCGAWCRPRSIPAASLAALMSGLYNSAAAFASLPSMCISGQQQLRFDQRRGMGAEAASSLLCNVTLVVIASTASLRAAAMASRITLRLGLLLFRQVAVVPGRFAHQVLGRRIALRAGIDQAELLQRLVDLVVDAVGLAEGHAGVVGLGPAGPGVGGQLGLSITAWRASAFSLRLPSGTAVYWLSLTVTRSTPPTGPPCSGGTGW